MWRTKIASLFTAEVFRKTKKKNKIPSKFADEEKKKNWGPGVMSRLTWLKVITSERKLHNFLMERHLKMESYMRKKGSFSCDTIFMVHQSALKLRKKKNS
jgi:hypothetical protein